MILVICLLYYLYAIFSEILKQAATEDKGKKFVRDAQERHAFRQGMKDALVENGEANVMLEAHRDYGVN